MRSFRLLTIEESGDTALYIASRPSLYWTAAELRRLTLAAATHERVHYTPFYVENDDNERARRGPSLFPRASHFFFSRWPVC